MTRQRSRAAVIQNVRYDFGSCWVCGDDLDDVVGAQVVTFGAAPSLTEVCSLDCARDFLERKAQR